MVYPKGQVVGLSGACDHTQGLGTLAVQTQKLERYSELSTHNRSKRRRRYTPQFAPAAASSELLAGSSDLSADSCGSFLVSSGASREVYPENAVAVSR